MTRHLDHYLQYRRDYRGGCRCSHLCGTNYRGLQQHTSYLLTLYVVTKLIYFTNAVTQIFLVDAFLATDYRAYGVKVGSL